MTYPSEPPTEGQPYYPPAPQQPYTPPTVPMPYQGAPIPQQPQIMTVKTVPTSGVAAASLVFGILGLVSACCSFGIPSILAVVLGHVALNETKRGDKGGHGMAVAGLILGYVVVLPAILLSISFIVGGGISHFDSTTSTP